MKQNILIFALLSVFMLSAVLLSCSRGEGGKESTDGTTAPETETDVPGRKPLTLYWLQWSGSSQSRPDGSATEWNWITASALHINRMHVHYLAKYEDGKSVKGIADPKRLAELFEKVKYEMERSNNAGIDVIGYIDTCQFDDKVAAELGYTLEQLCAKNVQGEYIYTTAWNDGSYIACVNSPQWREWLKEDLRLTAEAGFAGLQYDFHPYAAAGLFCHCENCKKSWAEYSRKHLGEEKDLLFAKINFSDETGRAYYRWKVQCFVDFMNETVSEAKKVNPDFTLLMNQNANGYSFAFESLYGAWDEPSSEFHNSDNGYSSTLYMYQLAEALGYDRLYSQYNEASQTEPHFRLKVNLAESFATIGGITYVSDSEKSSRSIFRFAYENPDIYADTGSLATAAVLYSAESNLFSIPFNRISYVTQLYDFANDRARQAASALLKAGVCYDYLAVEKDGAADRLAKYDLVVIPSYRYFDDSVWKPVINAAVKNGTKVIVIGKAESYVKALAGDADFVYIPAFVRAEREPDFEPGEAFRNAVAGTEAAEKVAILNNRENTAATLRSSDENHTYIHIIRRGGDENSASLDAKLTYTVPEGKKVIGVRAQCPYTENKEIQAEWNADGNRLSISTADFDTYAVITVITE